jgi:hypothetical protein
MAVELDHRFTPVPQTKIKTDGFAIHFAEMVTLELVPSVGKTVHQTTEMTVHTAQSRPLTDVVPDQPRNAITVRSMVFCGIQSAAKAITTLAAASAHLTVSME